jgi:nucleotide-binding universal stress UspA family protein
MRNSIEVPRSAATERAFRKILLAVDGPENSAHAVELAIRLAATNRADLTILHVVPLGAPLLYPVGPVGFGPPFPIPNAYFEAMRERTKRQSRWLSRLVEIAESRGVNATMDLIDAQDSIPREVANRASDEGADLVIVGSNDLGPLGRLIRGSVSASVMHEANCPVLVVRGSPGTGRSGSPD